MTDYKIAFTGSSGSGKTTLVKFVEQELGLKHISGSAGDIKTESDRAVLASLLGEEENGHLSVIKNSVLKPIYGINNQYILQYRRANIIRHNINFVTDRSPLDNLTYFINQVGFLPEVTDAIVEEFANKCYEALKGLTHLIYIKAVQPIEVENNGSRIANKWYQKSVDAQFEYWLFNYFLPKREYETFGGAIELPFPKILIIDFWDLNQRKENLLNFLKPK